MAIFSIRHIARPIIVILAKSYLAASQSSATCKAGFDWMNNTASQSPCFVAGSVAVPCNAGFSVPTLMGPPTAEYSLPGGNDINVCQCSSVYYSLLQACAVCQDFAPVNWSDWSSACNGIAIIGLPANVTNAVIPPWAYLDPSVTGTWNASVANAYEASPSGSITPSLAHTATSSAVTPLLPSNFLSVLHSGKPSPVVTATASGTLTPSPSSTGKHKTQSGAVIGGVVAGIGAIAFLGLALFWYIRKRRHGSSVEDGPPPPPRDHLAQIPRVSQYGSSDAVAGSYLRRAPSDAALPPAQASRRTGYLMGHHSEDDLFEKV